MSTFPDLVQACRKHDLLLTIWEDEYGGGLIVVLMNNDHVWVASGINADAEAAAKECLTDFLNGPPEVLINAAAEPSDA